MKLKLLTTFITFYSSIHEIRKHYQTRWDENLNLKRELTEKGNWNETISLSVCKQWHQCRRAQNSWVHIFSYYTELDLMSQPTHGTLCVNLCFLLLLFFKSLSRGNTWVRLLSLLQWTQEYSALWFHKIIKTFIYVVKWNQIVYPW